ncbi:unnamed protein product, partial [Sphacelaria rigidula]
CLFLCSCVLLLLCEAVLTIWLQRLRLNASLLLAVRIATILYRFAPVADQEHPKASISRDAQGAGTQQADKGRSGWTDIFMCGHGSAIAAHACDTLKQGSLIQARIDNPPCPSQSDKQKSKLSQYR